MVVSCDVSNLWQNNSQFYHAKNEKKKPINNYKTINFYYPVIFTTDYRYVNYVFL